MSEEMASFGGVQQSVEGILGEIESANRSLQDIIAYCTTNYELQRPEVFQQTKTYLEDAMTNAAYQIFRGATELTNLVDLHNYELLSIQASVQCLTTVRLLPFLGLCPLLSPVLSFPGPPPLLSSPSPISPPFRSFSPPSPLSPLLLSSLSSFPSSLC